MSNFVFRRSADLAQKLPIFQSNTLPIINRIASIPLCKNSGRKYSSSSTSDNKYDVAIVGAGIVGMATARQLSLNFPHLKLAVVDKEASIAAHQSSNNSGVIHAGIYYTPGSLKAKLCVEGLKLMYKYCEENDVPYNRCGKLVVAIQEDELERLNFLYERGLQNEVPGLRMVNEDEIREIEPHCRGLKAIHSPYTGIVDYGTVTKSYAKNFTVRGGKLHLGFKVTNFEETAEDPEYPVTISGTNANVFFHEERIHAKYVITCGGLYADRLAALSGCDPNPRIVPFRGEYLLLKPEKRHLVKGNIYPVPNPKFPFLGVHFTPRVNGDIWLGPNAVLAFKREGYKVHQFNPLDLAEALGYSGLRKLVLGNLGYAFGELYRGINYAAQVQILKRFIPELEVSDCMRGPAGVRAMAVAPDGSLVDDFVFDQGEGDLGKHMLHVRNAPSPACTSSLSIAQMIADKCKDIFKL